MYKDDENIDERKAVLLDTINLKLILEAKQTKLLSIPVPVQITFEKLSSFIKREAEFSFESNTKFTIGPHCYTYKEIKEKTLLELEISENICISIEKKESLENIGLLDEQFLNFNNNNNNNNIQNDAGNLNLETDVSSGNAEIVKTMSTSEIFFGFFFIENMIFI